MDHIDSYYARTATPRAPFAALSGPEETDVCIVGGGLAGVSTALELVRRGRRVALVEANRIGWGASGRNGGFVGIGFAQDMNGILRKAGPERAARLWALSVEGMEAVKANIAEFGLTDAQPVPGVMWMARHDNLAGYSAYSDALARTIGFETEVLDRDAIRNMLVTDAYFCGVLDRRSFHMHPLNYINGLALAVQGLGGRLFEESCATSVAREGAGWRVGTAGGSVLAREVVLCGGGYTDSLVPALKRAYLPIATYVVVTEAAPERLAEAIRTPVALGDDRRASDYYRLIEGGQRLLWGGRITARTAEPGRLAELLRADMVSVYPQLDGIKVETAWSGLMSYATHFMPQVGALEPGLWHATAFGGHGLNTTAAAGRVLAEAMCGESERIKDFAPFGLDWAGGPLGPLAVQMVYWTYQALDAWRERGTR